MSKFLKRSAQGAQVPHEKRTSNQETVKMPLPSKIVLSMGQHIGAPAAPQVAKGDQVCVGTVVGKAGGFVSSDIHSGVSGTVDSIKGLEPDAEVLEGLHISSSSASSPNEAVSDWLGRLGFAE